MRAAVFRAAGRPLAIEHCKDPKPGPGDVIVKVRRCGISEIDLGLTSLSAFAVAPGTVLGREVAGEIVALGAGVAEGRLGERVVVAPPHGCGHCSTCLSGRPFNCPAEPSFGGFAEFMRTPAARAFKLDAALSLAEGAQLAPLAAGLHAARAASERIRPERVLVTGGGAAAVSIAFWAQRLWSCSLLVASGSGRVRSLASAIGAAVSAAPAHPALLQDRLGGLPDVVFDSLGIPGSLQRAIALAGPDAVVLSIACGFAPNPFSPLAASAKGLSLAFPFGFTAQELHEAAQALKARPVDLVSSVITLEDMAATFERLRGDHDETSVHLAFS